MKDKEIIELLNSNLNLDIATDSYSNTAIFENDTKKVHRMFTKPNRIWVIDCRAILIKLNTETDRDRLYTIKQRNF